MQAKSRRGGRPCSTVIKNQADKPSSAHRKSANHDDDMSSSWYGGVAHLVEHLLCKQKVAGSSPVTSTIHIEYALVAQLDRVPDYESVDYGFESHSGHDTHMHAFVAQWIERWSSEPSVAGSNPVKGTHGIHHRKDPNDIIIVGVFLSLRSYSISLGSAWKRRSFHDVSVLMHRRFLPVR